MANKTFATADGQKVVKSGFYLFRHFQVTSLVAIMVILSAAGLGLRVIFRDLILYKAEKDAIGVSTAIRDCAMDQFVHLGHDKERALFIPQEDLPEFEEHMWGFLVPFDIIKIKIFDADMRIIYSTDVAELIGTNERLQQEITDRVRAEVEKVKVLNKHANFLSLVRNEFRTGDGAGEDME